MPSSEKLHALNLIAIHEDTTPQEWVGRLCNRVIQLVGDDAVRMTSWSISQLGDSEILQEAVTAAIGAEVIIVSTYAAKWLPPEMYSWIDGWLPQRREHPGALIALISVSGHGEATADDVQEYLRVVANLGRLDFMLREQRVPAATL